MGAWEKLTILLSADDYTALAALADGQYRTIPQQAAWCIHRYLGSSRSGRPNRTPPVTPIAVPIVDTGS